MICKVCKMHIDVEENEDTQVCEECLTVYDSHGNIISSDYCDPDEVKEEDDDEESTFPEPSRRLLRELEAYEE